jgi:hypothetical protein
MPVFAVMLRGENFEIPLDRVPERMGFYTTRFVLASNEADAENKAVELVRGDEVLRKATVKTSMYTPMIYLESLERRPWWHIFRKQQGFTFWNMDAESDEEPSNKTMEPTR